MRKYGNLEVGREASQHVLWPWLLNIIWYDKRSLEVLRKNLRFADHAPSTRTTQRRNNMWKQHFQLGWWLRGWAKRCQ